MTLFSDPAGMPAHLAAFEGKDNVLPRDTTPAITFRGKTWRLRQGGEEIVLTRKNAEGEMEPAPVVKVVVLNLNQKRSRMFYAGAYEEGKNQSPACWSSDGERPDKDVSQPVSATCASCPNAVKGSKITANNKETTACSAVKRIAVVPAGKLDMEPLLLKIPQTSMWDKNNPEAEAQGYFAWDQYVDFLRQRGVKHTAAVVTKIKFDSATAYPKLLFTAERWLEAADVAKVLPMIDSDAVKKLLSGAIHEGTEAEPVTEAPAAAPAPAASKAAPAPVLAPATPPITAKPAVVPADDSEDAFSNVGAPQAATAAPTKPAPKAAAAPKAPVAPAPAPKPPVAPPTAASNPELAALAAAWDD
jgi:hypothetical protein